ncbi:TPA: hypothetical protein SMR42_000392 [Pseudomonas putida]|nr:hypothetical protein [Pseudomonas putida]
MDTNKMREQFESAWRARYPEHGEIALKRSGLDPQDYSNTRVKDAWWAWQASREAAVVKLPNRAAEAYREEFDDVEGGSFNEAAYIRDVCKAIEAQGLKVKP